MHRHPLVYGWCARDRLGAASRWLSAQAEPGDDLSVPLDVVLADVIEQPPAATDELHQSPPGVMIALVLLEVLGEVGDALRENRDLDLGRAGIGLVQAMRGDGRGLVRHAVSSVLSCYGRRRARRAPEAPLRS